MKAVSIKPGFRIVEEPNYSLGSTDNERTYAREFSVSESGRHGKALGIVKDIGGVETFPLVLLGGIGIPSLQDNSYALHEDRLYVGIGNSIVAIELSDVSVDWVRKVDDAACFGIYWSEFVDGLISWGELEISRLTRIGDIVWSVSWRDIFSEGFEIKDGFAHVVDFEKNVYRIDLIEGVIKEVQ